MSLSLEVRRDIQDGTVWVATIARPERRNALDNETIDALDAMLREAATSSEVRALVLTGSGTAAFCAGSDLKAVREMTADQCIEHTARGQALMRSIEEHPCLVVAAIEGYALGGGLELALACDLRVAGEGAQFGLPEVTKGMLPGWGGTFRLTRAIGLARAQAVLLGGVRLTAAEALAAGLIMKVVEEGGAARVATDLAASLASGSTRDTYARAKALLLAGVHADSALGSTLELLAESIQSHADTYGVPSD
jgi:enoyl-CoA hydratase